MKNIINWGIIGAGIIAREFAEALTFVKDAHLIAVASNTGKEIQFAQDFSLLYSYNNYLDLVKNPEIDVIYIASTHNFHYDNLLLCLEHNKHVLCEKPLTINVSQALKAIQKASENQLFLMEAMWTRFSPAIIKLIELVKSNYIGEIKSLKGDFCIDVPYNPSNRSYNKNLAGGALLDLGIYPITLSCLLLNKLPIEIKSFLNIGNTGVDEESSYLLRFDEGEIALLSSAFTYSAPIDFEVFGTNGRIKVPNFYFPSKLIINRNNSPEEIINIPYISTGKNYEAAEVNYCIKNNKLQSDLYPLSFSVEIMNILDSIRKNHITYPNE